MVKNIVDVVFGGLSYWMFGFGKRKGLEQNFFYFFRFYLWKRLSKPLYW